MIDINISLFIQLFNFLVLFWLLDLLMFRPLLQVMDERKSKFHDLAEGFSSEREEIERLEDTYHSGLSAIHKKASSVRKKAKDEAIAEKKAILEKAEANSAVLVTQKLELVHQNLQVLEAELAKSKDDLVQSLNRKVLGL